MTIVRIFFFFLCLCFGVSYSLGFQHTILSNRAPPSELAIQSKKTALLNFSQRIPGKRRSNVNYDDKFPWSRECRQKSSSAFMAEIVKSSGQNGKSDVLVLEKIKSIIPPKEERRKLVPLALMFFAILFNYTILRDTKDVLMITAPKSGAEVIPFIKTYVNLPVGKFLQPLFSVF